MTGNLSSAPEKPCIALWIYDKTTKVYTSCSKYEHSAQSAVESVMYGNLQEFVMDIGDFDSVPGSLGAWRARGARTTG